MRLPRIYLKAPEAHGWRFSVFIDEGRNFVGHAMGWLEAQQLVEAYLDDCVRLAAPVLAEVIAEERAARVMELAQKENLTRPERAELARLNGHKLASPEAEQRAVEIVERILESE